MTRYALPARYLPPHRFRYPYRRFRRGGRADIAAGLALGAVLAAGLGAKTITHHHVPSRTVSPSRPAAPVPVASGSESAFIAAALADLGAPATPADIASMADWYPHENGSWPPAATDNPWNSTMPMPGSTIYNSVGVRNYMSASEGAQATALTLEDGYYPLIVATLRSGAGLCGDPFLSGEFLTWSGGGYSGVC